MGPSFSLKFYGRQSCYPSVVHCFAVVQGFEIDETDPGQLAYPDYEASDGVDTDSSSATSLHVCQYADCGRGFQYKRNLDRHQRQVHGALYGAAQQVAFFCSVQNCRRTFYCKSTLARHQRSAHGYVTSDLFWSVFHRSSCRCCCHVCAVIGAVAVNFCLRECFPSILFTSNRNG